MSRTESYIILKPIAERFNRIANDISDKDIEYSIKDEMRKQISTIDFKGVIQDVVDEYLDDNSDYIVDMLKLSIENKLKYGR